MFSVGEITQLRSGSPKMTVAFVDEDKQIVRTVWFVEGKVHRDEFPFDVLHKNSQCDAPIY